MTDTKNIFVKQEVSDKLRGAGIAPTRQRLDIAATMFAKEQHLSVEQLMDKLRQNGVSVSKATIYNTLNLFAGHGLVREVLVDPNRVFFDSNTTPHHHFYDVDSGTLHDFPLQCELTVPTPPEGMEVTGVDVVVRVKPKS